MTGTSQEVLREIFEAAPFVASLGIELVSAGGGECRTTLELRPDHMQQTGVVHAGVIATLADHTAGGAAHSVLPRGSFPLTATFTISLLRAATGDRLTCVARVVKAGRSLVVVDSEVRAGGGEGDALVAKATVTLAVLTRPPDAGAGAAARSDGESGR